MQPLSLVTKQNVGGTMEFMSSLYIGTKCLTCGLNKLLILNQSKILSQTSEYYT